MNRSWTRIALLVVVLASLAIVPAYGQSPSPDIPLPFAQTFFPATGDTMALGLPPLWRAEEDYAEGWRTFDNLPEISRVIYELVAVNGLVNGGQLNFIFRVNNERVGSFLVQQGEPATIVHADFAFEPKAGPDYKFFMEVETGIDPIQGAITIPLDTSPLVVFGFSGCPAETALNRADDAEGLALLRRFRNEMLGTNQSLRKYVDAYHNHSAEAVAILSEHPLLLARTARLLRRGLPAVQALLDGQGADLTVPTGDLRAAYRLLDDLSKQASPEFASALDDLREMLRPFEGHGIEEGWLHIASW